MRPYRPRQEVSRRRPTRTRLLGLIAVGILVLLPQDAQQRALDDESLSVVRSVSCDGAGNCWFATWGGILAHARSGEWVSFTTDNSDLAHPYCHDVAVDAAGMVWIGHHYDGGIDLLDTRGTLTDRSDDRWLNFDEVDGLAAGHSWVQEVYVDSINRKWFGHAMGVSILDDGGTPFSKDDDGWTYYNSGNSTLSLGFANAVLEDGDGCFWVGTDDNLSRLCGGTWKEYEWTGKPGCSECCWFWPGWVWDLDLDADGNLWVIDGSCGTARWEGGTWALCDTRDPTCGLPQAPASGTDLGARVAALDADGNLWFGTRGRGAARYDRTGHWTLYGSGDTDWLGNNWIEGLDFDTAGHGWFGTWGSGACEYVPETATSTDVTPGEGGGLTSTDGRTHVDVPPGAVDQPTAITLSKAAAPPTDLLAVHSFDLSAVISGTTTPVTTFNVPYTLTIVYGPAATKEGTLALYTWDGAAWQAEATAVISEAQHLATATPDHMTIFALLGETERVYVPLVMRRY